MHHRTKFGCKMMSNSEDHPDKQMDKQQTQDHIIYPPPHKKQSNTSTIQPGGSGVGDSGGDGSGSWCRQRIDIHTDITGNGILHGAVTAYYPAEEKKSFIHIIWKQPVH